MTETGFSVCHFASFHPACTAGQAAASYEGCDGWQTAPGGMVLMSCPKRELSRLSHFASEGQAFVPGCALHTFGLGWEDDKASNWRKYANIASLLGAIVSGLSMTIGKKRQATYMFIPGLPEYLYISVLIRHQLLLRLGSHKGARRGLARIRLYFAFLAFLAFFAFFVRKSSTYSHKAPRKGKDAKSLVPRKQ